MFIKSKSRDVSPNKGVGKQRQRPQKMEERTMGASRDLTQMFFLKKQAVNNGGIDLQKERFKPKSNILQNPLSKSGDLQQHFQNEQNIYGAMSQEDRKLVSTNPSSQGNLGSQVKFNNRDYEEQIQQNLPPVWIDLQDDVDDNLIQIKHLMEELRPLKAQRFGGAIFDEAGARRLDENISQLVTKITKILKQSEEKVKQMATPDSLLEENDNIETSAESQSIRKTQVSRVKKEIIQNVQQTYRQKLRSFAQELKSVEKEYLDKMVEMDSNKDPNLTVEQLQVQIMQNRKQYVEDDADLAHRNEKIPQIITQMNDLAELYKEMSRLVIEQGTIMDRIDQNVFEARFQVSEGKDKIADTLQRDTSPRAQACIVCLVQAIVICVIFLALKHT